MQVAALLSGFDHIGQDHEQLLNSAISYFWVKEKKFLSSVEALPLFITFLKKTHYKLLESENKTICRYEDIYLDSKNFDFYYQQLSDAEEKIKVRVRHYIDQHKKYFQVKHKSHKLKNIYSVPYGSAKDPLLTQHTIQLFNGIYESIFHREPTFFPLPLLRCTYSRCIFYSRDERTRVNIDLFLTTDKYESQTPVKDFSPIAVIELKTRSWTKTPFSETATAKLIPLKTFSKYSLGMYYCHDLQVTGPMTESIKKLEKLLSEIA